MRVLLDTHAFLYFISGGAELSPAARAAIENPSHQRFLSIASLWEIAIKASIQKLEVGMTMSELVSREVRGNSIDVLHIEPQHLDYSHSLSYEARSES
jgi:PIN domain nuclease of toxin-antitoxin system